MFNQFIQKVIARDGEREIVKCDTEEMHRFVVEGIRPEFNDDRVICVKFLQSCCESEEPEETVWYINPYYCTNCQGEGNMFQESLGRAYGPFMGSSFIPEIILVNIDEIEVVLKKYATFNNCLAYLGLADASDEEKLQRFVKEYNNIEWLLFDPKYLLWVICFA